MPIDPRQALLTCAEDGGDVAEGALWIAAEDDPTVRPDAWLGRIDSLADALRLRCGAEGCTAGDLPLMAQLLRERLRLRGAGGGDPKAHYLNHVIERACGVPIACAAIWIAIGRRANIPVEGVNLPGHFLVRVAGELLDPIDSGRALDDDDVRALVAVSTGASPTRLEPAWLTPAKPREILARMNRNLRGCYSCLENWPLALRAADRCVELLPDQPAERRDRGLLLWRMGMAAAALQDLRAYLELAPQTASDHAAVTEVVGRLRAFMN